MTVLGLRLVDFSDKRREITLLQFLPPLRDNGIDEELLGRTSVLRMEKLEPGNLDPTSSYIGWAVH